MPKCPYCGKDLEEDEIYCYFCEQEIKQKKTKKDKNAITAYCVKCNEKINIKNPKPYIMKNQRAAVKGTCPKCSTKVFRILGLKKDRKKK